MTISFRFGLVPQSQSTALVVVHWSVLDENQASLYPSSSSVSSKCPDWFMSRKGLLLVSQLGSCCCCCLSTRIGMDATRHNNLRTVVAWVRSGTFRNVYATKRCCPTDEWCCVWSAKTDTVPRGDDSSSGKHDEAEERMDCTKATFMVNSFPNSS